MVWKIISACSNMSSSKFHWFSHDFFSEWWNLGRCDNFALVGGRVGMGWSLVYLGSSTAPTGLLTLYFSTPIFVFGSSLDSLDWSDSGCFNSSTSSVIGSSLHGTGSLQLSFSMLFFLLWFLSLI